MFQHWCAASHQCHGSPVLAGREEMISVTENGLLCARQRADSVTWCSILMREGLIVTTYWGRNWDSARFSSSHTAPSVGGRLWTEVTMNYSTHMAWAPLQHCLLSSHFTDRETEVQESEVWVMVKSPGSRGQICAVSSWANYLPSLSLDFYIYGMCCSKELGENKCNEFSTCLSQSKYSINNNFKERWLAQDPIDLCVAASNWRPDRLVRGLIWSVKQEACC